MIFSEQIIGDEKLVILSNAILNNLIKSQSNVFEEETKVQL